MASRVTRSRARSETPSQVTDYFKTTKATRTRGPAKIIEEHEPEQHVAPITKNIPTETEIQTKSKPSKVKVEKKIEGPVAPLFEKTEKKASRTRNRTPSRQAELSTAELTGTPPKKTREEDIILENPNAPAKSAIEELMANSTKQKKSTCRTVADLQARLAQKGAVRALHAENLKNKAKQVEEHAEALKSPKKKLVEPLLSPTKLKSKAARSLFPSPKKRVPEYVLPGFNVHKSAEKIQEEQDIAHDLEEKRMTAELLKASQLCEEVKESLREPIQLPTAYENLVDGFKCVDKITSILQGQNRSCMAQELFKNVRSNSGKEFGELQLAQIVHVYPEAHKVEMRECRKQFGQPGRWELEVKPNLVDDLRGFIKETSPTDSTDLPLVLPPSKLLSPKKSPRKQAPALRQPELDGRRRLDAARMRDRAYVFRHKLQNIVKESHAKFLEEQGFPEMPNIKRMHPCFNPNKNCPKLASAKLPEPPLQKSAEHLGMKDALDLYMDIDQVKLPSFVQKAYQDLKSPHKSTTGASGTVPTSPKKFQEMQKEQKTSVLDRIRKKAELQKAASAFVDKDMEKRALRLEVLKNRYARVVCNRFTTKKVLAMKIDAVVEFLRFSCANPPSIADTVDHLKLLCEVAPMYVSETVTMNEKHLRFTDNNLEAIVELLEEEHKRTRDALAAQKSAHIAQMQSSHTPRPSKAARSLKFV
uniref:CDT1 domain-containing protein n=1 Tax=Caenorhabditis japonica TaxID=281687 RepID=A0A8R1DV23_CAEJA